MSTVKKAKPKKTSGTTNEPMLMRALVDRESLNVDDRTVKIVFGTDAEVIKIDKSTGERFVEILSFDQSHIRLNRMRSGAPVIDNHLVNGPILNVQLGVVERDSVVLNGNSGDAVLRFSKRDDAQLVLDDIKDGIICNVSVDYRVYLYRDITGVNDTMRRLLAIDWEPVGVSMVPIPADYLSGVRSLEIEGVPAVVIENEENQNENLNKQRSLMETPEEKAIREQREAQELQQRSAGATAERQRVVDIGNCARSLNLEDSFATAHIEAGTDINEVRRLAVEEAAKKQTPPAATQRRIILQGDTEYENLRRGLEEGLEIRAIGVDPKNAPVTEFGKKVANGRRVSLIAFAEQFLDARGISTSGISDDEIYSRAMSSTDFPIALANVMNKQLKKRYEFIDPQWKKIATKVNAKDFKDINGVRVDGSFLPGKINEQGEYPYAAIEETGDKFKLETYSVRIALTRKMIINDDLSAFTNLAPMFATGMAQNQANIVYGLLTANVGLGRQLGSDEKTLFHADHLNYDSVGAVMSIASFTAARTAMRRQKGLAGQLISVTPVYLVVPPELETLAYQLVNATIVPNTTSQANPFKGMFTVIVDPYLTDPKAWYLTADPAQVEIIKWATLDGQEGIFTEQRWNFDNDNLEIKARNDFGATIEEYVGIYKNKGA